MSKISYVQYLREVYPGKSEYLKMLPAGDPAGDNYGNIQIPRIPADRGSGSR